MDKDSVFCEVGTKFICITLIINQQVHLYKISH